MKRKLLTAKLKLLIGLLLFLFPFGVYTQITIWEENFDSYSNNTNVGTDNRWTLTKTTGINYFTVRNKEFAARDTDAKEQIFETETINISGFINVNLSIDVLNKYNEHEFGDYVNVYYILDGVGPEVPFSTNGSNSGNFSNKTATHSGLSGNTIKIIVKVKNGTENNEIYAFDNILVEGTAPIINVLGNSVSINNGDTTPSFIDYSNFGTTDEISAITRTFTIQNIGNLPLNLTGSPIVSLTGDARFSVSTQPSAASIAVGGSDLTFQVTFTPLMNDLGSKSASILIQSNDPYNPFTFDIEARVANSFFDSDNDGIFDDVDIDDDNDGIIDAKEELACRNSPSASQVNYKFLNETFGAGAGRGTSLSSLYSAETTYCLEDGDALTTLPDECDTDASVNDGQYTIASLITTGVSGEPVSPTGAIASWAWNRWANIEDHTPGDTNGRMAIFNADYNPGIFYETEIVGTLTGVPITYSFYVINLDKKDSAFSSGELDAGGHRILPNVTVNFLRPDRSVISSFNTGDITRCSGETFVPADHTGAGPHAADASYNQCETSEWKYFEQQITLVTETTFIVQFINNAVGGLGNDIAIDDIVISQTLCDMDSDGVADVFDLDSDNDGIPDVVEAGLGEFSGGTAKFTYTNDGNNNGINDTYETFSPIDSDGDGVPNYLDLDSDNDGLFDVDESGAGNTSDLLYQNGDGDINGDGVGDGPDSDKVRESDQESDNVIELYADGILDVYDFFEGNTSYADSYGNSNQGLTGAGWFHYVKDTDNDGIPDYMDLYSNDATNSDINKRDILNILHLYPGLDIDENGVIDGAGLLVNGIIDDADGDGILDAFDTSDNDGITDEFDGNSPTFGSPRDINQKLNLYFDGRNDYVEDSPLIIAPEATIMGWIKIDANPTGVQRILGQNNFYLQIDNSRKISAKVGGSTLTYDTAIDLNRWVHIAATYSCCEFNLYINGVEVKTNTGGAIAADTSSFTIGRRSNTSANYFKGFVDEVRVFSKALSENELQKIVYQEIENNGGTLKGSVVELAIEDYEYNSATGVETITPLPWANLQRYFRLDTYKDDIIDDLSTATIDVGSGAKMYNMKIIETQTAPLPFVTQLGGTALTPINLTTSLNTANGVFGVDAITSPASIVKIEHNYIYSNEDQKHYALFVSNGNEYTMNGITNPDGTGTGYKLEVSRYLYLNGIIDLEGESQLIQGGESILDSNSGGFIERDQQGTANSFNYNYWAAPISKTTIGGLPTFTASLNGNYVISENLLDGSETDGTVSGSITYPTTMNFSNSHTYADNSYTGKKRISTYWLYKFHGTNSDYYAWQGINQNTNLTAGEGYTMKGTSGNVAIATNQNYVFKGKPYNGEIKLPIISGNDRLIGNPYASALDADEFIKDNIKTPVGRNTENIFNGALYFWDHFGLVGSHNLNEYVGGYATYTLMGGAVAYANDERINNNHTKGSKKPTKYIPVGQAFFVIAANDTLTNSITETDINNYGGDIIFKNSQRVFSKEGTGISVFMKAENEKAVASKVEETEDKRQKINLVFDSPKGYQRQLLIGVDENTTNNFDLGYDGLIADIGPEDMYWTIQGAKLVIQGVPNFNTDQEFPLTLKIAQKGLARIKIDDLESIDNTTDIYIKDALTGKTHPINNQTFEIELDAGTYTDRFALVFAPHNALGVEEEMLEQGLSVFMNNSAKELQINNTIQAVLTSIRLYNSLGQLQQVWNQNLEQSRLALPINTKATGMYLVQIKTTTGNFTKKVVIE